MGKQYQISIAIAIVHFIIKYVETHVIKKDPLPVKTMFRESLIVFFSCILGFFIIDQINPMFNDVVRTTLGGGKSAAFTDEPSF